MIKVETSEEYGQEVLTVSLHLIVQEGEVFAAEKDHRYSINRDRDRMPLKKALKLARLLGVEKAVLDMLKKQGLALAEKAREEREKANDDHHARMRRAGELDARATRVLTQVEATKVV